MSGQRTGEPSFSALVPAVSRHYYVVVAREDGSTEMLETEECGDAGTAAQSPSIIRGWGFVCSCS